MEGGIGMSLRSSSGAKVGMIGSKAKSVGDLKLAVTRKDSNSSNSSSNSNQLPDSTTTVLAASEHHHHSEIDNSVAVTVDTAMDAFPDVIFDSSEHSNEEDDILLGEVMSCLDKQEEEDEHLEKVVHDAEKTEAETKIDILAQALSESDSQMAIKNEPPSPEIQQQQQQQELVSSTILGFPEVVNASPKSEGQLQDERDDKETQQILANNIVHQQQNSQPLIILNNSSIQPNNGQLPPPPPIQIVQQQHPPSDVYTLTLADGSIVQLRVQPPPKPILHQQQSQQQQHNDQATFQPNVIHQDEPMLFPAIPPERATSSSPPSVAEEVTLPFSSSPNSPSNSIHCSIPSSPSSNSANLPVLSPTEQAVIRAAAEATNYIADEDVAAILRPGPSTAFRSNSLSSSCSSSDASSDLSSYDPILSVFTSSPMDSMTIESLRSALTHLPEGQSADLGALLTAAKIDLTVDDIVVPSLTQVKRTMEAKGLADWQVQLCIKIRRRKKNTAAVRSSRRKRSQYVVGLREEVSHLKKRRKECQEENQLLRQLHGLWARLVQETERELQAGVQSQINNQASAAAAVNLDAAVAEAVSGNTEAVEAAPEVAAGSSNSKTKMVLLQQKEIKAPS